MKASDIESIDSPPGELKNLIDHWVEEIDDWIARLDQGMGGSAQEGADPVQGPALGTG